MAETMPALPVWQPWADLIVTGAKRIETRSYSPISRGLSGVELVGRRIAIYATVGGISQADEQHLRTTEHFAEALGRRTLARGAIIGTVTLVRGTQMTHESIARLRAQNPAEYAFGDYKPGRWAWVLEQPIACKPIEARPPAGRRGVFLWQAS